METWIPAEDLLPDDEVSLYIDTPPGKPYARGVERRWYRIEDLDDDLTVSVAGIEYPAFRARCRRGDIRREVVFICHHAVHIRRQAEPVTMVP